MKFSTLALSGMMLCASPAFAGPSPVYTYGVCAPYMSDCATLDQNFAPTHFEVTRSINSGTWSSSCSGVTTNPPSATTVCNGEKLNGVDGENQYPPDPCQILLDGPNQQPLAETDDWMEYIYPSGKVVLTCNFNHKDSN